MSDRAGWRSMLDEVTDAHSGELVTIEVVDPSIGSQHEAERLPFSYLTYCRIKQRSPCDEASLYCCPGRRRTARMIAWLNVCRSGRSMTTRAGGCCGSSVGALVRW
ncbi:DUF5335 family protein [Streptomyces barringtoniae]|uniref:DUF5335 family protein n=1 Tax=Streptomyces barringtoniae TaxID=2892029 RepID=UPI001E61943F|nr:DUF5335 family protein [Streptomyces barringtoniae]MCC5478418.1 DUF5335 domain-containing protein [Streptomyces barringtoniae]